MEAASQQAPDRVPQPESAESQNMSSREGEKPSESNNLTDQPLSAKGERMASSNQSAPTIGLPRDVTNQSGSFAAGLGRSVVHSPSAYTPQAQTIYYGGFGNTAGEWGEYRPFVAAENLDFGSPGIYNDNPSLMFHGGYGYSPQMPYGPYSPVTTPLPSVRGDGHLYSPQQFPLSGPPYYQQSVSPSMPYISSPAPVSQAELSVPIAIDQQGESMLFGPRPGYPSQFGSFGRGGNFTGNSDNASFYDLRQGFDGFGPWSDWSKSPDGHRSLTPLSSPAASPQPINMLGSFGRTVGMGSQQQRPLYGIGSGGSSYTGGYAQNGIPQSSSLGSASFASFGANDRWLTIDKARRRGRESGASCSCNGTVDILSEQNRGPRASKPRPQAATEHGSSIDANKTSTKTYIEPYNQPDFVTEYNDAKFFVIKSYSEDNVHKSIKYGVWASTPNGNRKLDSAYRGVKEKQGICPVFLFFSVNASAQFCGVAEMVGPVDFDKSVDYWQQDKWSGQFPVKWHIIKDVPNSQFRHIILENNDNKPVTNSRDTQEVKLEQGIEMLNIFKNYETDLSILDDFDFYEERQKMMQDRKARQQASLAAAPIVGGGEQQNSGLSSSNYIKQLSKSFKQVIKLDESNKEELMAEKSGAGAPSSTSTAGTGPKAEDNRKTVVMVSNMQGS